MDFDLRALLAEWDGRGPYERRLAALAALAGRQARHLIDRIDDRDLSAFLVYAARERSLDASLRAANKYGRSEEHKKSIDALRELNKKMLFRETRRDVHPF